MTKEEKAVVRAAIDYIAAGEGRCPYKKAALEQAVLRYLAKKAEEVRDAGPWPGEGVDWVEPTRGLGEARLTMGRIGEGGVIKAGVDYVGVKWEYYVWHPPDPDLFLRDLAGLGQHGWELVLRQPHNIYVFKRPMLQCGEEEQDESGS